MNHLKMFKRFQEGTGNVLGPGELKRLYAAMLEEAERRRAERLNEVEGHGFSDDVVYPEELELKRKEEQLKAQRAVELAMNGEQYAQGTGDVMDLERGNWPVSEEELKTLPDWLAHLLRGIPKEHTHGSQREQFMPRSVPVFQGPQGKYYDPRYSRHDERIMAANGTSDVQHLAGGESNLKPGALNDQWELPSGGGGGGGAVNWYDDWLASKFGITGGQNFSGKPFERGDTGIDLPPVEGLIPGGPFAGWSPEGFNEWHSGTPPSGMNYPEFTGTTAGPGGQQLAYETTSYNVPGYGWVPRAQLNNAQASNNLWDYLNPWGGTSKGGSNTGDPTQRVAGTVVGTLTNFFIPGLGFVTGPIARWAMSKLQGGANPKQVQQAVAEMQQKQKLPQMPQGSVSLPTPPVQGSGFDPWGNPDIGNKWSNDFGRGTAGPSLSSVGGTKFGQFGTGFGTGTVGNFNTAIGFGGSYGGGSNAGDTSRFASGAGYNRPYSAEQWANMRGSKKYAAPTLSTAEGGITPQMGYDQYLQMFHPIGSVGSSTGPGGAAYSGGGPQGIGGGKTSFKPNLNQKVFAMGTSDVGLKIFKRQQKLQGGTEAVPSELPTPPGPPEAYQSSIVRSLIDQVRQGILPDEALDEIKRDPTSARALVAMVGAALSAGTLLSGGRGGKIPKGEEPLIFGHTFEQIKSAQQGGRLEDPLRGPATKPSATDADRALLEKHGLEGLQEKGLFGVLDRLGLPTSKEPPQQHFMGTSDVNPGLKLFHQTQLKRKKP